MLFPPQHIAEQSLYATMLHLTYDIDIVANQKIHRIELPVTMPLQATLKQTLSFFNTYVKQTKGKAIHFELMSSTTGLRLEMIYTDIMDLEEIQLYLSEYLMLFGQKKITQLDFQTTMPPQEQKKVLQQLNLQLDFILKTLDIYEIQYLDFKQKINEFIDLLRTKQFDYGELNLNEINPGPAAS